MVKKLCYIQVYVYEIVFKNILILVTLKYAYFQWSKVSYNQKPDTAHPWLLHIEKFLLTLKPGKTSLLKVLLKAIEVHEINSLTFK